MKKRPIHLLLFAAFMTLLFFAMPTQILFLQDVSWFELRTLFQHLSSLNILLMFCFMISALLAFEGSRALLYFSPIVVIMVALNNAWVGKVGLDFSVWQTSVATFAFLSLHGILLLGDAKRVLLNPNVRWWRTAQRKKTVLPVTLFPWVGETVAASTCNISSTGVLVRTFADPKIKVGDQIQMKMNFDGYYDVRCTAELVRFDKQGGENLAAFRFLDLGAESKSFLKEYSSSNQSERISAA